MHEEALFRDLRRELLRVLRPEGGRPVLRVRIWVGALTHVTESRLAEAWPRIVEGTPASGARLEVLTSEDPRDPLAGSVVLRSFTVEEGANP
jgi:hydrogenase nickel incorporation protein HypA/HybF